MGIDDLPNMDGMLDFTDPDQQHTYTETIDLGQLGFPEAGPTESLDLGSALPETVHKLLHALPVAAMLVTRDYTIRFMNDACNKISRKYKSCLGKSILGLFQGALDQEKARSLMEWVFVRRTPRFCQGNVDFGGTKVFGRVSMRSIRFGKQRAMLVLVEDLTTERKRVRLITAQKKALVQARDELEKRVADRTLELSQTNLQLQKEVADRKRAELELRRAHGQLERRVTERTRELRQTNEQLRREIYERIRAQEKLLLNTKVIESSNEAIFITDARRRIVYVNWSFCNVTGFQRPQVLNGEPLAMQSPRSIAETPQQIWKTVEETGHWKGEIWFQRADSRDYPALLSISSVNNETNLVTNYVGIFSDITRIKETEQRLQELAHYDPLTSLPNRVLFRDRLERAMLQAERTGQMVVLMLVDLDRFKNVNDTFGHKTGDDLLISVGRRLADCVRKADTIARLGGDEFLVLMTDVSDARGVGVVAKKIIDALSQPYHLGGRRLFISASIGITAYPSDAAEPERLLQNADTALYHAKSTGKDNYQFFSEAMNRNVRDKLQLELDLRAALERKEFILHYQPVVDFASGSVIGAEALIRWIHPTRGVLLPDRFIPLAEETGLIIPLGEWVLREACAQNRLWQEAGLPQLPVSVNVSARQLAYQDLAKSIVIILQETNLDPRCLEIELTESFAQEDAENAIALFRKLKKHGVSISIDDFGKGYSSLGHLKRLPIDKLKIDRSFVKDIASDPDDVAIVEAIVSLARCLKLKVVAEGVETEDQLQFLGQHGCDAWQGYLFARPMSADDLVGILKSSLIHRDEQATVASAHEEIEFESRTPIRSLGRRSSWNGCRILLSFIKSRKKVQFLIADQLVRIPPVHMTDTKLLPAGQFARTTVSGVISSDPEQGQPQAIGFWERSGAFVSRTYNRVGAFMNLLRYRKRI